MAKHASKTFKATLERLRSGLGWVVAYVPFKVEKAWKVRGRAKVKGTINGFAFRTSLFPTRDGRHFILVNKLMQAGAGLPTGRQAAPGCGWRECLSRHGAAAKAWFWRGVA